MRFASDGVFFMPRSFTAPQVLLPLQDISVDYSDGEDSSNEIDDVLSNDLKEVEVDLCGEESGINSASEGDDNHPPNQVPVIQQVIGKDETVWQALAASHVQRGYCNRKTY